MSSNRPVITPSNQRRHREAEGSNFRIASAHGCLPIRRRVPLGQQPVVPVGFQETGRKEPGGE